MPSLTLRGPPAKIRVVPLPTSAFQGGPAGTDEGSALKVMLPSVMVIVPAEPVFKLPTTVAEAAVPNDAMASPSTSPTTTTRSRRQVLKTFLASCLGSSRWDRLEVAGLRGPEALARGEV